MENKCIKSFWVLALILNGAHSLILTWVDQVTYTVTFSSVHISDSKWNSSAWNKKCYETTYKKSKNMYWQTTANIQGAEIFNGLPKNITNCITVKSFRKSLKRHIIHSYIT